MPFPFRKKRKGDAASSTADIEQLTIGTKQNNENSQPNNSPLLMMRDETKKKPLGKSSSYSFISWLTPRKKTQSTQSISTTNNNNNSINTSLTSIEDNATLSLQQQTPKTPSTKSPRNSKLTTSQSTSHILDHVGRQKSTSNFSSSTLLSLTPLNNSDAFSNSNQRLKKRVVKSEKTPRTCSSPMSDYDEYHLGVKHSFTLSVISDEKSPRFVLSTPDHNGQELMFGSAVENIISDCDSDGFCFSPLVDETSPFQETANKTASTSILSDDQAEKDVDEYEIFEEWAKRFDAIPEQSASSLSTTQLSTKKKSASSSFSKLFNAVSNLDPFIHIHSTPSQKNKVKSLSPKSATTNDLFRNYNDSETGGAIIINDEPIQDKGRFSRSFKNLMLGKKSPVNGALSSLSPRHDKSPPPQPVVQHSRLLVVLPDEIKSLIFEFAEFRDILAIRSVCKELNAITDDDRFWQRVCFELSLDFSLVTYKHLKTLFIENQLHVTLVGDEGVGKSLLIRRFSNNPAYILETKGGRKQLYDSMYIQDEEPYYIYFKEHNKVDKSHKKTLHKEDVYFVCFSIFDKKSLSRTKKWIKAIRAKDITIPIILVGLKVDLRDEEGSDQFKLIKSEQGEQFKTRFKLFSYREVSNKTKTGLCELMRDAINAKRIQTEKFYNYDKTLGTEAEMEDISEDVFNYSDEDDMDGDCFGSALPTNTTTISISKTATLSKRLSQMKIKDSFVLD